MVIGWPLPDAVLEMRLVRVIAADCRWLREFLSVSWALFHSCEFLFSVSRKALAEISHGSGQSTPNSFNRKPQACAFAIHTAAH